MHMVIRGRDIAQRIYGEVKSRREKIGRPVTLGILVVGANPVIEQFVDIKARNAAKLGIGVTTVHMPVMMSMSGAVRADQIAASVQELARRSDGVIVQLPMPDHIDVNEVLATIPPEKDVDALNPTVMEKDRFVYAPVALAVEEILREAKVDAKGKKAVVVGEGRLVGAPSAALLRGLGAEVTVLREGDSLSSLREAEIVVLGAGKASLVHPSDIKDGVVLIDGGTSESSGEIRGDADPACAEVASVFTPVPGGVGPISVALIFKNLLDLVEKKMTPNAVQGQKA